jgi:hypothetical protein
MRVGAIIPHGQVLFLGLALFISSCGGKQDEIPVLPPPTSPLSRSVIGYGVISASYTHVAEEPNQRGVSQGYLRKSSIVRVLERRSIHNGGAMESWVLVDGAYRGWVREDVIQVYDSEAQAKTAAESMIQ